MNPLTQTLLSTIRLQRHIGTRVFISTQEPTISPALIDLCSMTIVHRFSSPEWLRVLRQHVAGFGSSDEDDAFMKGDVFNKIVKLQVGEALLLAPEAMIDIESLDRVKSRSLPDDRPVELGTRDCVGGDGNNYMIAKQNGKGQKIKTDDEHIGETLRRLGTDYIKMRVRQRTTNDGGKSVLAG
ncbi:hypothetical protein NHQ30_010809 [Ciborinia camelliae]|nr:hypothetical protein NHQ30_010809 [Ciborinia camelliae]